VFTIALLSMPAID